MWSETRRKGLYAAAGEWLESRPEVTHAELGEFWERAEDLPRAALYLISAAQSSARVADTDTTLALTDKVLGWWNASVAPPDDARLWDLLIARDDALQLSTRRDLQREGLTRLASLSPRMSTEASIELACRECNGDRLQGDLLGAEAHGIEAIALAATLDDPRGAAMAHTELVHCHTAQNRFALAEAHAREGLLCAERTGDPWLLAKAFNATGYCIIEQDRFAEALNRFDRAADLYKQSGDLRREALALNNGAVALLRLGRLLEARERLNLSARLSSRVGNQRTQAVATHNQAVLLRMLGDLPGAVRISDETEPRAIAMKHKLLEAEVVIERAFQALALRAQGDPAGGSCSPEALKALDARAAAMLDAVQIPSLAAGMLLARAKPRRGAGIHFVRVQGGDHAGPGRGREPGINGDSGVGRRGRAGERPRLDRAR